MPAASAPRSTRLRFTAVRERSSRTSRSGPPDAGPLDLLMPSMAMLACRAQAERRSLMIGEDSLHTLDEGGRRRAHGAEGRIDGPVDAEHDQRHEDPAEQLFMKAAAAPPLPALLPPRLARGGEDGALIEVGLEGHARTRGTLGTVLTPPLPPLWPPGPFGLGGF